jgi:hypothetical protein
VGGFSSEDLAFAKLYSVWSSIARQTASADARSGGGVEIEGCRETPERIFKASVTRRWASRRFRRGRWRLLGLTGDQVGKPSGDAGVYQAFVATDASSSKSTRSS